MISLLIRVESLAAHPSIPFPDFLKHDILDQEIPSIRKTITLLKRIPLTGQSHSG